MQIYFNFKIGIIQAKLQISDAMPQTFRSYQKNTQENGTKIENKSIFHSRNSYLHTLILLEGTLQQQIKQKV